METSFKIFKKLHNVKSFRTITAYILIFSLLWQNSLWATGGLHILEEDLEGARARIYAQGKVSIVEPGAVSDRAVHNVFEDLRFLEDGGVIFKEDPQAKTIYNRLYNKEPLSLSGTIEAEQLTSMVVANPGGITLENPDFKRIYDLNLIAGGLAETNKGIAYGVDQGILSLKQTLFEEQEDLKFLSLTGREVHVSQSLLSPSESITLTAGQHMKSLEQGRRIREDSSEDSAPLPPSRQAILLDESTILRSKNLFLQSLEEGASIHAKGLLQATDEDILLKARGDIYLDKLIAHRNLTIETTGKVFFGDQIFVGGNVRVKAANISVDKDLSSLGKLYLKATQKLKVKGTLGSKGNIHLIGQDAISLKNNITTQGAFTAISQGHVSQDRNISAETSIRIKGKSFAKRGILSSQGFLKVSTEEDINLQNGGITTSSWGRFLSKTGDILNRDQIHTEDDITFDAKRTQNDGHICTRGVLKTNEDFFNSNYGIVEAKSLANPLALLSRNLGKIELDDDLNLIVHATTLRGNVNTQGKLKVGGEDLTLEGHLSAQNGFLFDDLTTFRNRGRLSAFGVGLQGRLTTLHHEGKIDCSVVSSWIGSSTIQRNAAIRTRGHFILQGDHYRNDGKVFTCGVHQTTLTGSYKDTGTFYCPTLFLLNARDINYYPPHKSYLKDAVMRATFEFTAGEKVSFVLSGNQHTCFLQLSSQGDLNYNGEIRQFSSNRFPLLEYFNLFNQPAVSYEEFADELFSLPLGPWKDMRRSLGSGITLTAARNLNCQRAAIDPESGSLNLIANGQFSTDGARFKAGYFKSNNAAIQGRAAILNNTMLSSLSGISSVLAQDMATLTNSSVQGGQAARVQVYDGSVAMNSSHLTSSYGAASLHAQKSANLSQSTVQGYSSASVSATDATLHSSQVQSQHGSASVHGQKTAHLARSSVQGRSAASVSGTDVSLHSSQLESQTGLAHVKATQSANVDQSSMTGAQTLLEGGNQLTLSLSSLEGEYNKLIAEHINASSTAAKGTTELKGKQSLSIHSLQADGNVSAQSFHIDFSGTTQATSLNAEGTHLKNTGDLNTIDSLRLKGETVEQLGTTKAGKNSAIEATKQYIDSETSYNEAGNILSLVAENTQDFKGRQKADTLIVKLEDMNLLNLLNQTEAPITVAHLKEGEISFDEDFTLNRTLHLWAKRLENKKKFTATKDFIAHIQTTIMNQGSMDIHGKGFLEGKQGIFTKDIKARQGLGLKTDALLTLKGTADGGQGALSIDAGRIDADAVGTSVSTFAGTGVYITSHSDILARGARILSQGDAQVGGQGDINFDAVAYDEGNRTRYLSALYQVRGNLGVQTTGQFIGRALQASVGGDSFLKANRGVNIDSLASVYEAERWSYRTGWFDQNRHYGFREEAEFFRTNWQSQGRTYIHSLEAGISARGAAFFGNDEIILDAFGKVNLGAVKETIRHYSYDESGVWRGFLGSIDERTGSTERAQTLQAISNRKIGIFSRNSTIESDAPYFQVPEIELDGEQGIFFRPLAIHTEEKHSHSYSKLTFSPTSLGFEYGKQDTHAILDQEHAGTILVNHMKIRTGEKSEAQFTAHITEMNPGEKTDFTTDTDKLIFRGVKDSSKTTSDSFKVKASIDVDLMPGGGFDVSHSKDSKRTYAATVQNFGVFHNKRKGTKLIVQGGAQTGIEETRGEAMEALVDHNAQDEESQTGYAYGAHLSSSEIGAHGSLKGGKKVEADKTTGLKINKSTNSVAFTHLNHDERVQNNLWSAGASFSLSDKGASANVHAQYGDESFSATLPLDTNPFDLINQIDLKSIQLPTDFNLETLNQFTNQLSTFNNTLNNLGIDTGGVGDAINMAHQGTQLAKQGADFLGQLHSLNVSDTSLPNFDLDSVDKLLGQLTSLNHTLSTLGIDTGNVGDVINIAHQGAQLAPQGLDVLDQVSSLSSGSVLLIPTNFESFNGLMDQAGSLNNRLNAFGIDTGNTNDILNMAHQGSHMAGQISDSLAQAQAFSALDISLPIPASFPPLPDVTRHHLSPTNFLNAMRINGEEITEILHTPQPHALSPDLLSHILTNSATHSQQTQFPSTF